MKKNFPPFLPYILSRVSAMRRHRGESKEFFFLSQRTTYFLTINDIDTSRWRALHLNVCIEHSARFLCQPRERNSAQRRLAGMVGDFRVGLLNKCSPSHSMCGRSSEKIGAAISKASYVADIMGPTKESELSDLACIDDDIDHPVDLFRIWHDEARRYNPRAPDALCLATVSKECKVSARNVVLREFDNDGFVIVTDSRSRKVSDMDNVPEAAMSFLWFYINDRGQEITRQVRVEGTVKKLERDQYWHLYDREPLFCKIRAYLCKQGSQVDWNELKQRHDEILDSFRRKENSLPMPEHFVGYKLLPMQMEFYFARDHLIGDRLIYRKDKLTDSWKHERIAA